MIAKTQSNRNPMKVVLLILVFVVLFVVSLAGGTVYWLFEKAKNVSDSALNISTQSSREATEGLAEVETITMPLKDVAGKDLPDIPRYEGSVRSRYYESADKNFLSAEFYASATMSEISQYYKTVLDEKGWVLTATDSKTVTFLKEGVDLTLEFIAESKSGLQVTRYSLNWTRTN